MAEKKTQRVIVLFVDDTDAAEQLAQVITYSKQCPWKPIPKGANMATYKQERYSQAETDKFLLRLLKEVGPRLHYGANIIVPDVDDD